MRKNYFVIMIVMILSLSFTGCGANEGAESKLLLSSNDYPMEMAKINAFQNDEFHITIEKWEFVSDNTIYILATDGREFLADKENVTFFSTNK